MKLTGVAPGLVVVPYSCTGREQLPDEFSAFTGAGVAQNQEATG